MTQATVDDFDLDIRLYEGLEASPPPYPTTTDADTCIDSHCPTCHLSKAC